MVRLSKDGNTVQYVKDEKELVKFLPQNDTVLSVKFINNGRKILYSDGGWYIIEKVDKEFGVYSGDICQVCRKGELVDYGGCATCKDCGAQIKCGL